LNAIRANHREEKESIMATAGSYRIWTADGEGNLLDKPDPADPAKNAFPNPADLHAVDIYFGLDGAATQPPPKEQVDLQGELEKVLNVVRRLYLTNPAAPDTRFRRYYVRLFRLAQLGLEGKDASPEIAKNALATVTRDLVDDEAGNVKNGHMTALGLKALQLGAPFALAYVLLVLVDPAWLREWLLKMDVDPRTAANFMLLWIGCFLGVWLSYGIRTVTLGLSDLTMTDADRLHPRMRLLFAGALTMVLGQLFVMGVVEVKLGSYVVTTIASNAMLAFVVGVLCGISELALPAAASKRATAFVGDVGK
jgi:hypothetical protein